MNSLTEYITHNLSLGYDLDSIRDSLLSSGYELNQINSAIDYVMAQGGGSKASDQSQYKVKKGHGSSKSKLLIVVLAIFVVIIGLVGVMLLQITQGSSQNPGQTAIPKEPTYRPPTTSVEIKEPQSNTNDRTSTGTQTPANPTTNPQPTTSSDPSSNSFDPLVDTSATFESRLSRLEIDEKVQEIASEDSDEALKLCKQIIPRGGQNNCIIRVAVLSENYRLCELIKDDPSKDTCYINFAINEIGGSEVCRSITNEFKRSSCFDLYLNLAELEELQRNIPSQTTINETQIQEGLTGNAFT